MKKNIFLILSILLAILAIVVYGIYNNNKIKIESEQNNRAYKSFYEKQVLGTDLLSIINKAIDNNEKNSVKKGQDGNYIPNNKNSIIIEVKFKELDKVISMEAIEKNGLQAFLQNFATINFKCTKIEYHQNTKNVKYMYFEEI